MYQMRGAGILGQESPAPLVTTDQAVLGARKGSGRGCFPISPRCRARKQVSSSGFHKRVSNLCSCFHPEWSLQFRCQPWVTGKLKLLNSAQGVTSSPQISWNVCSCLAQDPLSLGCRYTPVPGLSTAANNIVDNDSDSSLPFGVADRYLLLSRSTLFARAVK